MAPQPFMHLTPGAAYIVTTAFRDWDGVIHPIGERWTFLSHSFLPYEDGLSLFVTIEGADRQIRLNWRDEEQGPIIDDLEQHLSPAA